MARGGCKNKKKATLMKTLKDIKMHFLKPTVDLIQMGKVYKNEQKKLKVGYSTKIRQVAHLNYIGRKMAVV